MTRRLPAEARALPVAVRVGAALEALPARERRVLALLLLEQLTPLEAAGALGTRVAEIERVAAAALERIRQDAGVPAQGPSRRKSA